MAKNLVLGPILADLILIWAAAKMFFSKIWFRQSLDTMANYSCTTSEKTNDPILRKHIDGPTDRRTRMIS